MADEVVTDEERLRELRELQYHRLAREKYRYYEPIGKVEDFINKFGSGKYTYLVLEAANGIGKTLAATNILAHLFWPVGNQYFQSPLFLNWPYPKKGRIISDPNTVTETIIPTLHATFPEGHFQAQEKFTTNKEGKRYESHWQTDTGWEFTIMTYEQDPKEFESATLGFIWGDEPMPQPIYKANIARLRMGGIIFMTETPLSGSQWIYDDFIDVPPDKLEEQKKILVHAEVEDACMEHGIRGFIPHERIETMASQYDEDDKQARLFGKHSHLSGLIFKKWTDKIHVIKPFRLYDKDWLVVHALDPHPRVNDAGLWVAFGRDGRIIVVDELWGNFDTDELTARIKGINKGYRLSSHMFIDPSAFNVDKHTGLSLAGDLHNEGLIYEPGSKERTNAIRLIRDMIDFQFHDNLWIKTPKLFVFDTCPQLIWEMSHWQWEDWQGKTKEYKELKEKPVDKNDHLIENLGRILLAGIKWEPINEPTPYTNKQTVIIDPYSQT